MPSRVRSSRPARPGRARAARDGAPAARVAAGARTVELSRPDKLLFPDDGLAKRDVAEYYAGVADAMLPHLRDRPLNVHRFPNGVGAEGFFQQHAQRWYPSWLPRIEVPKEDGTVEHPACRKPADLVYLAGQACLAIHAWPSRADRIERPDRLIFDLDPSRDDFPEVVATARELGELLRDLGLEPFAMTTGSRGLHVTVPLERRADFGEVRAFAKGVAELLAGRHPERLTLAQRKAKRGDRLLIDTWRTRYAHTAIAPYSLRSRPGAPVATPLAWEELSERGLRPDGWSLRSIPARLAERGDPWAAIASAARPLGGARGRLARLVPEAAS